MAIKMSIIPDGQIQTNGLKALKDSLGVVGALKFLEQFDNGGSGDYTAEKYEQEDELLTKEDILALFK